MDSVKQRNIGADIIKIAAAVFVIFVHHKVKDTPAFQIEYILLFAGFFLIAMLIGAGLLCYGKKHGWSNQKSYQTAGLPLLFVASLLFLSKFAVSFFLMISGFMLASTMEKRPSLTTDWYRSDHLIPRILRFYLPLIPVVITGLFIHIFIQDKAYDWIRIMKRFLLGGFAPGSYYIVVMIQILLFFPLLYKAVSRWKEKGILFILGITLIWDIFATGVIHISENTYKFCAIRLLPQVALGIYAKVTELKRRSPFCIGLFLTGLIYVFIFVYWKAFPLPLFYQWRSASLFVALFLYPIVTGCLAAFQNIHYSPSRWFDRRMVMLSNATYHIFLIQMLYYNMIGYNWNKQVDHILFTMPINLIVCIIGGVLYYKISSPIEARLLKKVKQMLSSDK